MITLSGAGSGLDIDSLVSQLVAAERQRPEQRLSLSEATAQARFSVFGQLKSAVSVFQSAVQKLDNPATFQSMSINSSDSDVVSVSTNGTAANGNYAVQVSKLAAAHSLASGSFVDSDTSEVGTGTLTIRFGTTDYDGGTDSYNDFSLNPEREILTLEIDSSNNTLQGVSDAINAAAAGVSSTVVNDGSGYRLLLSSEFNGAENSLEVSALDDDGLDLDNAGLSQLSFNSGVTHMAQTVAASDAALTINGLAVTSASNRVDTALDGVVLELKQLSTEPVQVAVNRDLAGMEASVRSFVTEFNKLQTGLSAVAGYNADTEQGGLLQGDFTINALEGRIRSVLRGGASGVQGELQYLADLGILTQNDGTLAVEGDALSKALTERLPEVIALFSALGQATDSGVSYVGGGDATQVGNYAVNITQAATAGLYAGAGVLPDFAGGGLLAIDADNDAFSITVDGVDSGPLTLTQGSYSSGDDLASEIQARINSATALQDTGLSVLVSYSAATGNFSISSKSLGSSSSIEITAVDTNMAANLGLSVATGKSGLDVAGTIGGEAATGSGQTLTAAAGTAAEGLGLLIQGAGIGNRGDVNFSRGLFNTLGSVLDEFLGSDGLLDSRTSGLQSQLDSISVQRDALDVRMEAVEARYRRQFGALDILLQQLQSTSAYLADQLDNLPRPGLINKS